MIETYAPLINAIAVLGSFIFVIISSVRKSRREKIDELKTEMDIRLTQDWDSTTFHLPEHEDKLFKSLSRKFQQKKYNTISN